MIFCNQDSNRSLNLKVIFSGLKIRDVRKIVFRRGRVCFIDLSHLKFNKKIC